MSWMEGFPIWHAGMNPPISSACADAYELALPALDNALIVFRVVQHVAIRDIRVPALPAAMANGKRSAPGRYHDDHDQHDECQENVEQSAFVRVSILPMKFLHKEQGS